MHALQSFTDLKIRELVEGIEIRADCAREEDWVLGDDCEAGAEGVEVYFRDVDAVDYYASSAGFEEAEEGEGEGRFSCF